MRGFRLAAIAAVVMMCCPSAIWAQSRVDWITDLGVARQLAQQQHRLLLIHFWSNSCPPCLRLERYVFNQPEVVRAIHSSYVPVKINATENPQLASQFRVKRWPTDIIATVNGQEIYRGVSQQDPNRYIAVLDQVAANTRVGFPVNGPASTPVAQAPSGNAAPGGSAYPTQNTAAGLASAGQRPVAAGNPASRSRPAPQVNSTPPQYTTNRYVGGPMAKAPGTTPPNTAPMAPPYGSQFTAPQAGGTAYPLQPPSNRPAPQAQASANVGRSAAPSGPAAQGRYQPVNNGPSSQSNSPAPPASAEANAKQPPLGLEGYCPVTLVEQQKWVKGDPRWGAIHEGRTYLFTGPEEQKRFLAEFDKYAPVLSGYDPVQYVETGKLVDGKRAHGVFYRDQIYLFQDEASLQQFWQAPERYALAVLTARQQRQSSKTQQR